MKHKCAVALASLSFLLLPVSQAKAATTHIRTVWVILMENRNWSEIKGSKDAPYINHTLLPMASYAEQYFNPPKMHPSLPDYLWLEAGTNFGILDDDPPRVHSQATHEHLVTLLQRHGISWKAYEEDISGRECPLADKYPYGVRHNAFVYFDDVTGKQNARSPYCVAHIRPMKELARDLKSGHVARYNFVTPNVCNDMHDRCPPVNNEIAQGDRWLAANLPIILNSKAYREGGVVFITWDEAALADGPIGMVVVSPFAKGQGYANSIHYTHGSTLRTIEEIFGVSPFLGDAARESDLRDLFRVFP
ncbi:MAG TPA: alkaline phosphatase family protein [Terriglobales bacterium]|nr:alkaline phosphatase family protein [Terriglobales bacterium]